MVRVFFTFISNSSLVVCTMFWASFSFDNACKITKASTFTFVETYDSLQNTVRESYKLGHRDRQTGTVKPTQGQSLKLCGSNTVFTYWNDGAATVRLRYGGKCAYKRRWETPPSRAVSSSKHKYGRTNLHIRSINSLQRGLHLSNFLAKFFLSFGNFVVLCQLFQTVGQPAVVNFHLTEKH